MKIYFTIYLIPVVAVALLLYWGPLRGERRRLALLIVTSLAVLSLLHPIFAVVVVGLTLFTHRLVAWRRTGRLTVGQALTMGITVALVVLAVGKYGHPAARALWGQDDWVAQYILMPLGISYFVFRLLQYVFDQLRGVIEEHSFFRLLAFVLFLPTFPAGPLETYQGFYGKRSLSPDRELIYRSVRRIILGYFKKAFVIDLIFPITFGHITSTVLRPDYTPSAEPPLMSLAFVIIAFLRAYLDLSAYTDLAIGFSGLFGFRIMENFNRPLLKKNLSEFWQSYHISLSNWCRNNVYFPVFGLTRKAWVGLYASMLTMGLWHYVNLNWAFWALWHASGLVAVSRWKLYQRKRRKARTRAKPVPQPASVGLGAYLFVLPAGKWMFAWWPYVVTFLYVSIGYAFAATHTLDKAVTIFAWCFYGPILWLVGLFS
ncbi:MAG TPA: MBOAT family O-acyltransferase [Thermoleophilia bacterium]|nr:MBOAT family O-acyltransferase [Thermoleophilia bacterium]